MAKRHSMSRSGSKRLFTATALRSHGRNYLMPMRGGIRL